MKVPHTTLLLFLTIIFTTFGCKDSIKSTEEHFASAQQYVVSGYKDAAAAELKKSLDLSPGHVPSLLLLNKITTGSSRYREMLPYLLHAEKEGVKDPEVLMLLAEAAFDQNYFKKSLMVATRLTENTEDEDQSMLFEILRAKAFIQLGEYDEATTIYNSLKYNSKASTKVRLGLNEITLERIKHLATFYPSYINLQLPSDQFLSKHFNRGEHSDLYPEMESDLATAEKNILILLKDHPERLDLNLTLAEIYFYKNEYAKAIDRANKSLVIDHKNTEALYISTKSNLQLGYIQAAEHNLHQLLAIDREHLDATNALSAIYLHQRKLKKAEYLITPLIDANVESEDLYINMGVYADLKLDEKKSIVFFKKAAEKYPNSAYANAQLASAYLHNKQHEQAIKSFAEARLNDTGNLEINLSFILVSIISGDHSTGLKVARSLVGQHPSSPSPSQMLGLIYLQRNDLLRAHHEFENALSIEPEYSPARIQLAKLHINENKFTEAEKLLKEGLKDDPDHVDLSIELAHIEDMKGLSDKAINRLKSISLENPFDVKAKVSLADLYLKTGDINRAIRIKKDLDKADPIPSESLSFFARLYKKLGNTSKLVSIRESLQVRFPTDLNMTLKLASAYASNGQVSQAKAVFHQLTSTVEDIPDLVLYEQAKFLLGQNAVKTVKKNIKKLLKSRPGKADGYILYADLLNKEGHLEKSLKIYRKALKKEPSSEAIIKTANTYEKLGKGKTAARFLQKWSEKERSFDINLEYMNSLHRLGTTKAAIAIAEKMLKKYPDNILVLSSLSKIYLHHDEHMAWDLARKAYELSSETPLALDSYGTLCIDHGRFTEGIDLLEKAVSLAPYNANFQFNLAHAYHKSGRVKRAQTILKKLLETTDSFSKRNEAKNLLASLAK